MKVSSRERYIYDSLTVEQKVRFLTEVFSSVCCGHISADHTQILRYQSFRELELGQSSSEMEGNVVSLFHIIPFCSALLSDVEMETPSPPLSPITFGPEFNGSLSIGRLNTSTNLPLGNSEHEENVKPSDESENSSEENMSSPILGKLSSVPSFQISSSHADLHSPEDRLLRRPRPSFMSSSEDEDDEVDSAGSSPILLGLNISRRNNSPHDRRPTLTNADLGAALLQGSSSAKQEKAATTTPSNFTAAGAAVAEGSFSFEYTSPSPASSNSGDSSSPLLPSLPVYTVPEDPAEGARDLELMQSPTSCGVDQPASRDSSEEIQWLYSRQPGTFPTDEPWPEEMVQALQQSNIATAPGASGDLFRRLMGECYYYHFVLQDRDTIREDVKPWRKWCELHPLTHHFIQDILDHPENYRDSFAFGAVLILLSLPSFAQLHSDSVRRDSTPKKWYPRYKVKTYGRSKRASGQPSVSLRLKMHINDLTLNLECNPG